jgi:site-specific DNA-methyltransferase (adenine-specific)
MAAVTVHLGSCLEFMRTLPAASIDAIITDPPYGTTDLEFDRVGIDWAAFWLEARRITKPAAVIVMFAADLFTVDLIQSARDLYRYRLVWEKTRFTGFLDANRRPLRSHEDVLVFCAALHSSTYNAQKRPADRYTAATVRKAPKGDTHWGTDKSKGEWQDDGTRHPGSILRVPSIRSQDTVHPTQKPVDLMRWLVASYTNPGDIVFDPFAGSGSTGVACAALGREFVGCEIDPTYHALAQQRVTHALPSLFGDSA